jgi:NDP-sugar pyrophosphorylase family protein
LTPRQAAAARPTRSPTRAQTSRARALRNVRVVVLAGGRGRRLAPFTSVLPKPLMPIGDRSILEIVVEQLADHGFRQITFCVGHLSHLIQAVFNNGAGRRVDIRYTHEPEALGTAGPLRLVADLDRTFLVMNGDILTTLDYAEFVRHHRASGNVVTIAAQRREIKIDYGVLELEGRGRRVEAVRGYREKPEVSSDVSMGVYAVEPKALEFIPAGYFDFPDLVHALLDAGQPVGAFLHEGLWLDIGRHEEWEQATAIWTDDVTNAQRTATK